MVKTLRQQQYNRISLKVTQYKILNRTEGEIDAQHFKFSDILGTRGGDNYKGVHAWTYNGETEWYGYQPTVADMDKIAGAVESYAAMFQAEDMNMTM